jgi:hypothetical protein
MVPTTGADGIRLIVAMTAALDAEEHPLFIASA